jgi:hypothetical protein
MSLTVEESHLIAGALRGTAGVRIQYSATGRSETQTRLPEGLQPAFLGNRTGPLIVGDQLFPQRSDIERTVDGALRYVRHVAAALPAINIDDERIVDGLLAKRTASLAITPLRRRENDPR